ncbi:pentatricopeptide repeat-containing protein At4g26680, mitochondrial isoform X1 [Cynara cardunculus var. scolymus]|uniref:pentatricopeptide repeat-containing protein At4g26680, mitochondrial isoform X1 n=1 Tax=Cynara cardunculus var. scolymus TaxID=59895 RepID=UPI000D62CB80|nr:pentatricopeptide repeat-containing protein At4g26680, mitochondrial isoform X1 [Cynara cardunculus var. scolymus]XP_024977677.1 pentatricopeptide repeat-containing protein At4g26680, mitochondrial isoform X1 [Cynara cardunculus var. scolymus]XP_024977678.1 pentatricopeptide repeat-containing protein At4g26680, mitochondrial isoform X1 [Cynara cardunculus var. scolymus]
MNFMQIRRISTLLDSAIKNPNSSLLGRRKWIPIPIPHRTIHEPRGQDLDYINVAHSHLLHSDWAKLDELLTNFDSFRVKHVLLKLQNDYAISLKFFKWVETHNPNLLTLETNCIILHILTKNHKFVSAESVLEKIVGSCDVEMHSKLFDAILHSYRMCDSTPRVFDALFKLYAQMKQFRNATDTFCRMKEYGFLPTIQSCNLYMSSLLSLNRAGIALSFYKEIRRSKITVNVFTLNIVINAFCQLGELENAVKVFDEMQDMGFNGSVSSYNTLIAGYVHQSLLTTGIKLKVTMEKNGVRPNAITYNTLIHGFCKEGRLHDAYKLFNEMKSMDVAPNTITYNILISGYCQAGKTEKGNEVFEEMLRNGIKADILTYNALLLGLCNEGKTRKAAYLVKELDKKKLVPNSSTFAALIRGQCARKNPDRALKLYKSMLKSGCRPNEHTLKMLMLCFLQNDDYGGVFDVLKEMLERPVGPDLAVLRKLCKGLSQAWKDRLIMNLSNEVDDGRLGHGRYEKVKSIITQSNAEGKELEQNA